MKISNGKVVKFTQTFQTRAHGDWGTFEKQVVYPNDLDQALVEELEGMGIEDTCTIHLSHLEKYIHDESLVITVPLTHLEGVDKIQPGMIFTARMTDRSLKGVVKSVSDNDAIIDCNLPLLGLKNVLSNIRILEVREQTKEEKTSTFQPSIKVV